MIAQRAPVAAPVVRGVAEALPFRDRAFDVAKIDLGYRLVIARLSRAHSCPRTAAAPIVASSRAGHASLESRQLPRSARARSARRGLLRRHLPVGEVRRQALPARLPLRHRLRRRSALRAARARGRRADRGPRAAAGARRGTRRRARPARDDRGRLGRPHWLPGRERPGVGRAPGDDRAHGPRAARLRAPRGGRAAAGRRSRADGLPAPGVRSRRAARPVPQHVRDAGAASLMQFAVVLPSFGPPARDPAVQSRLRDVAEAADELGYHVVFTAEHLVYPQEIRTPHPYGGRFPFAVTDPVLDVPTTLAWVAAVTKHVRLAASVMVLPYHDPIALAKALTTIDVLSGGRLMVGVASGWLREEFD